MIDKAFCPLCGDRLIFFEKRSNIREQPTDILICKECLLLANSDAKEDDISLQKEGLRNIYSLNNNQSDIIKELDIQTNLIKNTLKLANIDPYNKTFFELGYGKGLSLFAASKLGFKKVIGVDLTSDVIVELKKILHHENIKTYEDIECIDSSSVDCIYIWHTLEHINEPMSLFREFKRVANLNCKILIQLPQYKKEYIFEAHHYFFTETSIRKLLELNDFKIENILYDFKNEFITIIGCKFNYYQ